MTLVRKSGSGPDTRVRPASPFRVLSFDPGGTTGVARAMWRPPTNAFKLEHMDQIEFEVFHLGPGDHHERLWNFLAQVYDNPSDAHIPLEIVCESFQFRQHINASHTKTKVELFSVEYIGIIKLFCQRFDVPLTFNTASAGKTYIPDKGPQANVKLKQLDWYRPGMVHGMDAARHLTRYLVANKKIRSPITDRWL